MASNQKPHHALEQAGSYTLDRCEIVSYKNVETNKPRTINIAGIISSIELTEDIFEMAMVGKLQVYDVNDVRTILPITGLERLNLKFQTPGMPGVDFTEGSGKQFHIYKIERVRQDPNTQRTQGYDIYFTSKEFYYNFMHRISKAYAGPIEFAIEDILRSKDKLNSSRAITWEPTKTNAKYVIPNLRPFNAIKFLCSQAVSKKYNNAGYVFYEAPAGYFFRSLESMYAIAGTAGRPEKFTYTYQVNRVDLDVNQDMHSCLYYHFGLPANVLENMGEGMFANKLITHDAFNKTVKTHNFDYYKSFIDYFHVETTAGEKSGIKQLIPFAKFDDTDKDISQFPDARVSVVTDTSKVHNDYEFVDPSATLPISISQRRQLHNNVLTLIVNGNSLLTVGDIISFDLPLMRPVPDGGKQQRNPYYSGRYLITALRHIISTEGQGKYQMTLKCSKDAVKEAFYAESTPYQSKKGSNSNYDIYEVDESILSKLTLPPTWGT